MDNKNVSAPVFIGIIVVVVLIVGYFVWKSMGPSEPVLGPGQSIQNPLGTAAPRGGGARGGPAPGGQNVPAPGTSGPQGFGPSKGAPIPR
jgi:hypothetical protein